MTQNQNGLKRTFIDLHEPGRATETFDLLKISLLPWTPSGPIGYLDSDKEHERPIHYLEEIEAAERYRIVLPLVDDAIDPEHPPIERLVETAGAFGRDNDGELLILGVIRIPRQTPLSAAHESSLVEDKLTAVQQIVARAARSTGAVKGVCVLTRDPTTAILHAVRRSNCDALLMGVAAERPRRRLLRRDPVEKVLGQAECDTFVMKPTERSGPPKNLLLAVSNGPHSELATRAARTLASEYDIDDVTVLHAIEGGAADERWSDGESIITSASRTLEDVSSVTQELVEAEDIRQTIICHATDHDVTVLGAPTTGTLKRLAFGSAPDSALRESVGTALTARSYESVVQDDNTGS